MLIYVKTLITIMISHNDYQQWLNKVGNRWYQYSVFIFRTGLRATHVVLGGYLVPMGTVLVTPDLIQLIDDIVIPQIQVTSKKLKSQLVDNILVTHICTLTVCKRQGDASQGSTLQLPEFSWKVALD